MVRRVILLCLLLAGLTAAPAEAAPLPFNGRTAAHSDARLLAETASKPRAILHATKQKLVSGKVGVWVSSNAQKVRLNYIQADKARTTNLSLTGGHGTTTLGAGASKIYAQALATTQRRPSARISVRQPSWKHQLRVVARQQFFFGHQSVGYNILEGVTSVYAQSGITAPTQDSGLPTKDASIGEVTIGSNRDPLSKLDAFEDWLRNQGAADASDVVLMKLCFVDVTSGFDARAWFKVYRARMNGLEKDFPDVTFLHATAPLTTYSPEDNVARQQLNRLLRAKYGVSGRLVDLASVESTRPDGRRVKGELKGKKYFAMYDGYTSDGGHLNEAGSAAAATELVHVISRAVRL